MAGICRFLLLISILFAGAVAPAQAQDDANLRELINVLAVGKLKAKTGQINAIAAARDARAVPALQAMIEGRLYFRKADKQVFVTKKAGRDFELFDPLSVTIVETVAKKAIRKIKVNNKLRRLLRQTIGSLTLQSDDPVQRLAAANAIFKSGNPDSLALLETALAGEKDTSVKQAVENAHASAVLNSERGEPEKIAAIDIIAAAGDREALAKISALDARAQGAVKQATTRAITEINKTLAFWDAGQNIWYGLSLGSVLLLAAIGLAITFGVMGVINMAHGEMVMLGAYTTFFIQEFIRQSAPGLFDYSLFIAIPAAFLVAGAFGFAMERSIIRFLYGRPLETLLATWGVSLILQQAVRTLFGPTNQEVGTPSWMSGSIELGGLVITLNRLCIVIFALIVFTILLLVLKRTRFGLQMRAVTQNRAMASSMGIRTPLVDAFTFALGSGIAGIAGVALSQIDNVSPNLGQSYIIDSFMVVVFGGVGNLWGTLVGALSLGIANKFLEPYAGAVLAKILVLVAIILFIQRRPRGLFALKGRAVEA